MGEMINVLKFLLGKLDGKRPFWKRWQRWWYHIKIGFKTI
jgi:hypothetical protein